MKKIKLIIGKIKGIKNIYYFQMSKTSRSVFHKFFLVGILYHFCNFMMWILAWPFILIGRWSEDTLDKLNLELEVSEWIDFQKKKEANK